MKRIWILGLLCILLTIGLVAYNIFLERKIILQESRSDTVNLVNLIEMDLVRTFSGLDQIFLGLEHHLTPDRAGVAIDPPAIRRIIDDLVLENPYLTALMVLDAQGRILYWNNNFQKPDLSRRHYFHVHKTSYTNGLFFGPPQPSLVNPGQWIFGISKAMHNPDHSLNKVMAAIIDLAYFDRQYRPMLAEPGVSLIISSPEGNVYASISAPADQPNGQQSAGPELNSSNSDDSGQQLSITRKAGNLPLLVTVMKEKSAVLSAWKYRSMRQVGLGLAVCLTLLFMTSRAALYQRRQREIRQEMFAHAGKDPLTQLVDRQWLLELAKLEIKKAIRKKSSLSVILLELDHFKAINDKHGHALGDEVLKSTARLFKRCSRETDILSRFGGIRFLLLLPDTDLQGAMVLARKIRVGLEQKDPAGPGDEFRVTASFGVSQWASNEKELQPAIARADTALSEVMRNGRNNIRWMPSGLDEDSIENSVVWLHSKDRAG